MFRESNCLERFILESGPHFKEAFFANLHIRHVWVFIAAAIKFAQVQLFILLFAAAFIEPSLIARSLLTFDFF